MVPKKVWGVQQLNPMPHARSATGEHTFSSLLKQKSPKTSPTKPRGSMAVSMREVDAVFQGAGQKDALEIWRIEKLQAVPVPKESHGRFFTGDSYVILKTTALKNGSFRHDIHYWLGKDTSQDEAGTAAIKTVELDAALGGRAVQYREVQGNETERFLSYFKPCIIPEEGGIASGFRHTEINEREHVTRLFVCRGKHTVHVKEVPFARSSLNHDDIFILDTKSKIFQFNGSNSSIQERAKALEVVQYLKDSNHEGKCDVGSVEDGKLMADADAGEFWGLFGGFAPLPRKTFSDLNGKDSAFSSKLICLNKGQTVPVDFDVLTRELLDSTKCYLLDCGSEIYVWMGRETPLEERKRAGSAAEELLREGNRPKSHIVRLMEGFETVIFRSKFSKWPKKADAVVSDESRGKVAALLKRQGFNVKGLAKAAPVKEEPQPQIDCTGNLQVWRVNGTEKTFLSFSEQCKFYSGDCYIFQYSYPGEEGEECLIGTWFGKKSVQDEKTTAISVASKMVESLKFQAVMVRLYEGKEPAEFFSIFQNLVIFKGGVSTGYKKFISENGIEDDTYSENGVALFRVQGSGPENMQAIQVDTAATSLNSSYCYVLHDGDTLFTWIGNLSSSMDQELAERQLDVIKPNLQSRMLKEGSEYDQFWKLLGVKSEYPSQKIAKDQESDPHLFSCTFSKGVLKVREIFNFTQDDLMTEDVFILDCHSCVFVWVGQRVDTKMRAQALSVGEKFLELDILMENSSQETPVYVITEGSEPQFFTRFFTWDSAKSAMHGNSFERRLSIVKDGVKPKLDKPKRRPTTSSSHTGRSSVPDKSQRSRSMSFSPDRVRVRGRSPAFNALAANFENPNARNLSTPPPAIRKPSPKSPSSDPTKPPQRAASIAAISASFERPRPTLIPKSIKASPDVNKPQVEASKPKPEANGKDSTPSKDSPTVTPTIQEDLKEGQPENEEGLPVYPYERLRTSSINPVTDIDVTKRETYLSAAEFRERFGMTKEAFAKLPKWKQNRLKIALQLF
ncbi:villin-3 isoform X1 [Oryza glaberrima]|uniref:villin-3 isoform X1 n=2 Tax=Oryza glaberrima TaxID=4538 RepID=UPI00224C5997|nr:villin-3 isoform X1 [Oryza glaberrima]